VTLSLQPTPAKHRQHRRHPHGGVDSPDVDERGLAAAALVAQEELGALDAAVVEVGLQPAGGDVDAGEALGHRLARRPVDDGQVHDGRLGPAGLGLRQVLLQRRGLVRQTGHHKVVGHPVTLVLDHGWADLGERGQTAKSYRERVIERGERGEAG